jgi:hypothetical protein
MIDFLAVIALGLSAGAMLTEAAVLVPYWRSSRVAAGLGVVRRGGGARDRRPRRLSALLP